MERLFRVLLAVFVLGIASANAANVTVNMTGIQFSPKNLTVNVGDTVTWVNQDSVFHDTVSGVNRVSNGIWKSPLFGLGGSFSFTFNIAPGTYPYFCTPHAFAPFNMTGTITVIAPNAPPSVSITNPLSGATFTEGANILIEASATDDDGVARVEFFANGSLMGTDFAAPFSASLNNIAVGNYSLTATAFDAQGLSTASAAVNISVNESTSAPSIISQPQSQSVLPGSTVEFSVGASGTPPLTYQWQFNGTNISGATMSSLMLDNVQTNDSGNYAVLVSNEVDSTLSALAILTVTPLPNIFPVVSVTSPLDGGLYRNDLIIVFQVEATDEDGQIAQVEYFLNTNSIGVLTNAPYDLVFSNFAAGTYVVVARVTDDAGGSTFSAPINFFVLEQSTVVISQPVEGARFPLGANILVAADVTASGFAPIKVQFLDVGGHHFESVGPPLQNPPFSFLWMPLSAGTRTLLAVLTDEFGAQIMSAPISIEVFEPGTQNPTIAITNSPKNFSRLTNSPIFISGIAGDDIRLDRVEFQVNGGTFIPANGTTNWIAEAGLAAGTNVIQFRAVDFAGNFSTNETRTYTYVVNSPLAVEVRGLGKVSPNLNGLLLEIGKFYQMIARPGSGQIFGGWEGAAISNKAVLNFQMESNLVLTAHFIPNPFPFVKGNYAGLIFETNNVRPESSGIFKMKVTARGAFSGKLTMQNKSYPLRGQFDYLGRAKIPVLRRPIKPVVLTLNLNLDGTNEITGEVTDGEWISELRGGRILSGAQAKVVLPRGKYFFDLISDENKLAGGMAQFGSVLKIRGRFSEGSMFAQTLFPLETGESPICLFVNSTVVFGWLDWRNAPDLPLTGHLIFTTTNLSMNAELVPAD